MEKLWTEYYQKGFDCALQFDYIPEFKNEYQKKEWERGYKDGMYHKKNYKNI